MEIKVKGCNECVMYQYYPEHSERYCNITDTKILEDNLISGEDRLITPTDCPLRDGPVTIKLE